MSVASQAVVLPFEDATARGVLNRGEEEGERGWMEGGVGERFFALRLQRRLGSFCLTNAYLFSCDAGQHSQC